MKAIPKTNKQFQKAISRYESIYKQAVNDSEWDLANHIEDNIDRLTEWMGNPDNGFFNHNKALILAEGIFNSDNSIAGVTLEFTKPEKAYYNVDVNFNIRKVSSPDYDPCYPED